MPAPSDSRLVIVADDQVEARRFARMSLEFEDSRILEAGADAFLAKPLSFIDLVAAFDGFPGHRCSPASA